MRLSELIRHYSKPEISSELARFAQNREIAIQFGDAFGKRPDILQFPADVLNAVRKGATSFHFSEEHWADPMQLGPETTKKQVDDLRIGWDLVLDIDCKTFEWSTICAKLLLDALKYHEVNCASIKFSGGTGWHIGVPGIALSDETIAFPETPQIIAQYLREFIKPHLADRIIEHEKDLRKIVEKSGKKKEDILKEGKFDPFSILGIDTIAIAPRHLLRMPYSLNEKKWLVSVPIKEKDLASFRPEFAKPENAVFGGRFLDTETVTAGEASQLMMQALDWWNRQQEKETKDKTPQTFEFAEKVPMEAFPPCMKLIWAGLPDGRKRALFVLINFLKSAKWGWSEIEAEIRSWNNRNTPPLKSGYLQGQLNWHKRQTSRIPPTNCRQFYQDFAVCKPDVTCDKIKNPISYPRFKLSRPKVK